MRASLAILPGLAFLAAAIASPAAAQPAAPAPASMEPPGPPPTAPVPATYYQQSPAPFAPPLGSERSGWFGAVGLGGMGYLARSVGGSEGSGIALEGVGGKWIRDDVAVGARLEAHTDDAALYTDSSFTAVARFPLGAGGKLYLEPGFGLAFHQDEISSSLESGLAVAMSGGYALTGNRFAFDLRFGLAHFRFDDATGLSHGSLWLGAAIGFQ